jgi:hypothetical protein
MEGPRSSKCRSSVMAQNPEVEVDMGGIGPPKNHRGEGMYQPASQGIHKGITVVCVSSHSILHCLATGALRRPVPSTLLSSHHILRNLVEGMCI